MICSTIKKVKPRVSMDNAITQAKARIEGIPHFFFIESHNAKRQGADNYKGESENSWSIRIGKKLQVSMSSTKIPIHTLGRPSIGGYSYECRAIRNAIKKITKGELSFGYNCHFNATNGAKGSEGLVAMGTTDNFDDIFADIFTDKLALIGIKQRNNDGVKLIKSSHNGWGMLNKMKEANCISIIGEPCFNYRYTESISVFEFEDRFVSILKESILESYKQRGFLI